MPSKAIFLQELTHEFQRRPLVPSRLDQHIEDFPLGIDGVRNIGSEHNTASSSRMHAVRKSETAQIEQCQGLVLVKCLWLAPR
jgi:hypothetical protein